MGNEKSKGFPAVLLGNFDGDAGMGEGGQSSDTEVWVRVVGQGRGKKKKNQ